MSSKKKAHAHFDGFYGWRGQAQQVIGGSLWDVDHPFVQDNPHLFHFPDGGEPSGSPVTPVGEENLPPYVEWTVPALKEECRARDLPQTGTKSDLVARLEDHDRQLDEEEAKKAAVK